MLFYEKSKLYMPMNHYEVYYNISNAVLPKDKLAAMPKDDGNGKERSLAMDDPELGLAGFSNSYPCTGELVFSFDEAVTGGVLTCALIFLPRGNTDLFLGLYFVAHLGRVLVDNAIPTMLYPIVEPQLAGAYNAWRSVLYGVSSIIVMPIVSSLLEHVHPLVFLIPGAVFYLIVTVWYYIEYRRITGK